MDPAKALKDFMERVHQYEVRSLVPVRVAVWFGRPRVYFACAVRVCSILG